MIGHLICFMQNKEVLYGLKRKLFLCKPLGIITGCTQTMQMGIEDEINDWYPSHFQTPSR